MGCNGPPAERWGSGAIIGRYISPFQSSGSGWPPENFEVPLAAAPRLDHVGRDDVDQNLGEGPPFRVVFQVIGGVVPRKTRIEHQRQEQVEAVVDDDELAAGRFWVEWYMVLLGAVRADIALERELARDDVLDGDLLVPAVAAVALVSRAARRPPSRRTARNGLAMVLRDMVTPRRFVPTLPTLPIVWLPQCVPPPFHVRRRLDGHRSGRADHAS